MFRPGNLGHLGRLGLVAASRPSLVAQALAILAKYGSAANLYLPGVGAINGITAGNWLDSAGTTPATVDNPVGRVDNARGGANLVQATTANKPVLRRGPVNQLLWSGDFTNSAWTSSKSAGAAVGALTAGPDGQQSARLVTYSTANEYLYQGFASYQATAGQSVTMAIVCNTATRAGGFGGGSPSGTDVFTAYNMGGGWWLQTVARTFTVTTSANTLQPLPGSGFGLGAATVAYHRVGLFVGTVTAQQIIDAGGIPLTTTAPASSTNGPFAWDFVSSDSFTSTMTPGNAGFFCTSANVSDSGVLRTLLGAGAGSDASSGVWLARQVSSNLLMLQVGNGTTRNSIGAPYPVATNAVASAGWDSSAMFVGINGTETSGAKTVDCTSANTMNLGVLTGTTNPMLGTIGATIIMPIVLPTATERATLRQFIASLSGVTM